MKSPAEDLTMARPDFVNDFLDQLADAFIARVMDRVNANGVGKGTRGWRSPSPLKGKHFSAAKMRCRYPGCNNRSKGPKFSFLCEEHLKMPRREVKAAVANVAGEAHESRSHRRHEGVEINHLYFLR